MDANGDGRRDPYDPEDAIFAAASYLRASGMPADTAGAIFSYNHADWYVSEVLANAGCFGSLGGSSFALEPQVQVLSCNPAKGWDGKIPADYLNAFESAAGPLRARASAGSGRWPLSPGSSRGSGGA